MLVDSYRRTRGLVPRRQVKWLLWGTAAGVFPFLAFYALPFALGRAGLALELAGYGRSRSSRSRSPTPSSSTG